MRETDYLKENQKVMSLLRRIEKFKPFTDDDLRSFLDLGKLREYEPGEVIIKEGDLDCWVYFLISGEVKIVKQGKDVLVLRRSGDLFGEMGVIDGAPRSATIWARSKTMALGVDCSLFDRKQKTNDLAFCYTIYRLFAEVLADRLRLTTEAMAKLQAELQKKEALLKSLAPGDDKTLWV